MTNFLAQNKTGLGIAFGKRSQIQKLFGIKSYKFDFTKTALQEKQN